TGEPVAVLRGHQHSLYELAYSPDGARLATASLDDTARVWDARTGELLVTLRGHEDDVVALAYSPDGARL
ncbi:MAG: hypothetical protein KC636_00615, partial [Myxococcales bacterium]|nr:hypothetical protein [Myxococcales bacterium]